MNDELLCFLGGLVLGAFALSLIWIAAIDAGYARVVETIETGIYLEYQDKLWYAEKVVK